MLKRILSVFITIAVLTTIMVMPVSAVTIEPTATTTTFTVQDIYFNSNSKMLKAYTPDGVSVGAKSVFSIDITPKKDMTRLEYGLRSDKGNHGSSATIDFKANNTYKVTIVCGMNSDKDYGDEMYLLVDGNLISSGYAWAYGKSPYAPYVGFGAALDTYTATYANPVLYNYSTATSDNELLATVLKDKKFAVSVSTGTVVPSENSYTFTQADGVTSSSQAAIGARFTLLDTSEWLANTPQALTFDYTTNKTVEGKAFRFSVLCLDGLKWYDFTADVEANKTYEVTLLTGGSSVGSSGYPLYVLFDGKLVFYGDAAWYKNKGYKYMTITEYGVGETGLVSTYANPEWITHTGLTNDQALALYKINTVERTNATIAKRGGADLTATNELTQTEGATEITAYVPALLQLSQSGSDPIKYAHYHFNVAPTVNETGTVFTVRCLNQNNANKNSSIPLAFGSASNYEVDTFIDIANSLVYHYVNNAFVGSSTISSDNTMFMGVALYWSDLSGEKINKATFDDVYADFYYAKSGVDSMDKLLDTVIGEENIKEVVVDTATAAYENGSYNVSLNLIGTEGYTIVAGYDEDYKLIFAEEVKNRTSETISSSKEATYIKLFLWEENLNPRENVHNIK